MKKLLFASAALAAFIGTSAFAADMAAPVYKAPPPVAPVWSWTGFYLGANVGGAWANHSTFTMSDPLGSFPFDPFSFSTSSPASAIGGVHGGYNYQAGPSWLVGLEADFSWTGLKLTGNSPMTAIGGIVIPNANAFDNTKVKDIGTVRARLGVLATPAWLFYVTGGYAYADIGYQGGWTCGPPGCAAGQYLSMASFSKWQSGWVAGAGTEYHIGGTGWILGAEYLYYGLNDGANSVAVLTSVPAGSPAGGCTSAAPFPCNPVGFGRFGVQELRARLSYKF